MYPLEDTSTRGSDKILKENRPKILVNGGSSICQNISAMRLKKYVLFLFGSLV
jgi:hypothetical protein